MKGAGKGGKVG